MATVQCAATALDVPAIDSELKSPSGRDVARSERDASLAASADEAT